MALTAQGGEEGDTCYTYCTCRELRHSKIKVDAGRSLGIHNRGAAMPMLYVSSSQNRIQNLVSGGLENGTVVTLMVFYSNKKSRISAGNQNQSQRLPPHLTTMQQYRTLHPLYSPLLHPFFIKWLSFNSMSRRK